jgi:hypothetical protein
MGKTLGLILSTPQNIIQYGANKVIEKKENS